MSYKVRRLASEVIQNLLPTLEPPPESLENVTSSDADKMTERMTAAKQHALSTYWPHLLECVETKNVIIRLRDGDETAMRIYRPKTNVAQRKLPVLYALHGGGFVSGSIESEDLICRQFCAMSHALVFSLEYRLAPQEVVEVMFADAEDGLKWCYQNAPRYNGDLSAGIVLSGTSSGATMASMLTYRSKSLGIKIRGTILRQPALILGKYEDIVPESWLPVLKSRTENWDAPILSGKVLDSMHYFVRVSEEEAKNPNNFPIFASVEQLKSFPPVYIVEAECDPLMDESEIFADKLREAEVPVITRVYRGMPHGFHSYHVLQAAREEMMETADGLEWILGQAGLRSKV